MTMFYEDTRGVVIHKGSQYYAKLCSSQVADVCTVTASEFTDAFFGNLWWIGHNTQNLLILLVGWLLGVQFVLFAALRLITYSGK